MPQPPYTRTHARIEFDLKTCKLCPGERWNERKISESFLGRLRTGNGK